MSNYTVMAAKIKVIPDVARKEILDCLRKNDGNREDAANELGVARRTFYRWLKELDLYEAIDELLFSLGYEPYPGPPRKAKTTKKVSK